MKTIQVGRYKTDNRSRFVYLGAARVKAVELQPTERGQRLLDIVFEVSLEDQEACEFLIRLETSAREVASLHDKLEYAIEHPLPHPWENDLFSKAVSGVTPREYLSSILNDSSVTTNPAQGAEDSQLDSC